MLPSLHRLLGALSQRWRHRLNYFRSPLLEPAAYRALLILVIVGIVLIATVPECYLFLPALDAVGWDVVTLFVVFELRHYLAAAVEVLRRRAALSRLRAAARVIGTFAVPIGSPALRFYVLIWPGIAAGFLIHAVRAWYRSHL